MTPISSKTGELSYIFSGSELPVAVRYAIAKMVGLTEKLIFGILAKSHSCLKPK